MPLASNTPPPTVAELAYLEQAVRANPKGAEFVTLGAAYLRLGRPADAIRALGRGLTHSPNLLAARLLIGRAYLLVKDLDGAQAHLVKAVKADPQSLEGFTLLGQTLLEKGDRARAAQMLERAQALAPRNAEVAGLLARARDSVDTDLVEVSGSDVELVPPTPVPAPVEPVPLTTGTLDNQQPMDMSASQQNMMRSSARLKPSERPRQAAAPNKQVNLGGEAKLRSAALGDEFLPRLLAGGLLAVPNVTARDRTGATRAHRRQMWRTLLRRALIMVIIAGVFIGGFLTYSYVARRQRAADMTDTLSKASALLATGQQADLLAAAETFRKGLNKLPADTELSAGLASALALEHLWYGVTDEPTVMGAVTAAEKVAQGTAGARELAVARIARDLASADARPSPALDEALAAADKQWPGDATLQLLGAERAIQLGNPERARQLLERADAGGKGPALAAIRLGDLALDQGNMEEAEQHYQAALARAENHPLALLGRSFARVERGGDPEAAMEDLSVGLAKAEGARVTGYRHLALALVWLRLEDFEKYKNELDQAMASGIKDARFELRVALAHFDRGQLDQAAAVLAHIVDPGGVIMGVPGLAHLARAEVALTQAKAKEALELAGSIDNLRAHTLRGRALLDLGQPEQALTELEAAVKLSAEEGVTVQSDFTKVHADPAAAAYAVLAWLEVALAKADVETADKAYESLAKQARANVSGLVRYVLGEANLARGKPVDARRDFETSLDGDSPLAYRARSRLAVIYLEDGQLEPASEAVTAALAQAPAYRPALLAQGRLLVAQGKTGEGLRILTAQLADGSGSAGDELAYASALISTGQLEAARTALAHAREKGAKPEQLAPLEAQVGGGGPPAP